MESRAITILLFLASAAYGQGRVIGSAGQVLYYRSSNDTVYFSATPISEESGVEIYRDTAFITEGDAADTLRVSMSGIDSIVFSPPPGVALSDTAITGSANIAMSYSSASDTFGLLTQEMAMRAYYGGVSDVRVILLRTFDAFWGKASLSYSPDIAVASPPDISTLRDSMREFLYPAGYPEGYYDLIRYDTSFISSAGDVFPDAANMKRIDYMGFDYHIWTNKIYRISPRLWNGKAAIVAQGHWGDWAPSGGADTIANKLTREGYEVFFGYMPLNGHPSSHSGMEDEEGLVADGRPLTAFVDHYIRLLNWIEDSLGVTEVPIMGVSGGGWQVPITMAIDERLSEGFGFAGSYPLALSSYAPGSTPHYEQGNAADNFYSLIASYEDLYMLGISGGRAMHLFHNPEDECCYGRKLLQLYAQAMSALSRSLGGAWNGVVYYPGPIHGIGLWGDNYILQNLD